MNTYTHRLLPTFAAAVLPLLLFSCVGKSDKKADSPKAAETAPQHQTIIEPSLLPDRFRQAGYMISEERNADSKKEKDGGTADLETLQLKVGSSITTTQPIPLREAMKAIVRTKNMSLSWAPDVDQELLVDIDIRPNDNFYEAVDNILRQLDYFQEVEGSTMVIKYRETKQYNIAMPFIEQKYSSSSAIKSLDSLATLNNTDNTFNIWGNIQKNLDSLIETWSAEAKTPEVKQDVSKEKNQKDSKKTDATAEKKNSENGEELSAAAVSRRESSTKSSYTIDKPVGLITVHAPRSLQKKIGDYLVALEKELYKQIVIEAKIIEVQLDDSSSLGINWHQLLDNLSFNSNSRLSRTKNYNKDVTDGTKNNSSSSSEFLNRDTTTSAKTDSLTETSTTINQRDNISGSTDSTTDSKGSTVSSSVGATTDTSINSDTVQKNALTSTSSITSDSGSTISGLSSGRNLTEKENNSVGLSDSWSMGGAAATAATIITNGTSISETLSAGASLITSFSFPDFIKALQAQGQASILSNPKISVMNGQPALISVGKNVTYIDKITSTIDDKGNVSYSVSTDKVLSGVGLTLSAVVKKQGEIVMNLVPMTSELSEPIGYKEFGGTAGATVGLPVVNRREMNTTVTVKDGSMLVVGGLISDKEIKSGENFLPGTQNIPYLRRLFGYEEKRTIKRELIILLRPRIIN